MFQGELIMGISLESIKTPKKKVENKVLMTISGNVSVFLF